MTIKHFLAILVLAACAVTGYGQTVKSLGYNTTNGQVVYSGTNTLRFTNGLIIGGGTDSVRLTVSGSELTFYTSANGNVLRIPGDDPVEFSGGYWSSPETRAAFGFSTNLGGLWTATNAAAARTNLGLAATAQTIFKVMTNDLSITNQTNATTITDLTFDTEADARYVVTFYPITMSPANSTLLAIVASNSTVYGFWNGFSASFASINELTNAATFTASTNGRGALQVFYVEGGTNAGSISATFQSSVATNTNTIKAGSFIRADIMP
jgi:hypothetical protein